MPARTSQTTAKTAAEASKTGKAFKRPTPSAASGGVNKRKATTPRARANARGAAAASLKNGETKVLVARRKPRRIPQAEQLRRKTLREIKLAGASPKNHAIRLLPFKMLIKEIISQQPGGAGLRIQTGAVEALRELAEDHVVRLFKHTEMIARRCGRPTIMHQDMTLARTIADSPLDRGGKRTLAWTEEFANEWKLFHKEQAAEKAAAAARGEAADDAQEPAPAVDDDAADEDYESTSEEEDEDEEEEEEEEDEGEEEEVAL